MIGTYEHECANLQQGGETPPPLPRPRSSKASLLKCKQVAWLQRDHMLTMVYLGASRSTNLHVFYAITRCLRVLVCSERVQLMNIQVMKNFAKLDG
jgi:hypothetical protein